MGKQTHPSVMLVKKEDIFTKDVSPQQKLQKGLKYQVLHAKMFAAANLVWPPDVGNLPGRYAHLLVLRSQEILSYDCQTYPVIQGPIRILHLGQSMSRVQSPKETGLFPCIIPHGGHWDRV